MLLLLLRRKMSSWLLRLALFVACVLSIRCTAAPGTEAEAHTASKDTCASCGVAQPEDPESGRLNVDFLEAVKRHILSRLQMRERPNITHPVSRAAMVTALRKLHAGKVREDGRVEIPNLDGHPMSNEVLEESSEIISFAEKGA